MAKNLYDDLDLLYREIWGRSLHHGAWVTGYESIEEARETRKANKEKEVAEEAELKHKDFIFSIK